MTHHDPPAGAGTFTPADDIQLTSSARLLIRVGSLAGLGRLPASGTISVAVVGIPLFWLLSDMGWAGWTVTLIVVIAASILLHEIGDRVLGVKDSPLLVWDELCGYLVAVAGLSFTWKAAVIAFLLERFLDIVKVPPARWIERRWPGGWGVVGDDIVAGVYTRIAMLILSVYFPQVLS